MHSTPYGAARIRTPRRFPRLWHDLWEVRWSRSRAQPSKGKGWKPVCISIASRARTAAQERSFVPSLRHPRWLPHCPLCQPHPTSHHQSLRRLCIACLRQARGCQALVLVPPVRDVCALSAFVVPSWFPRGVEYRLSRVARRSRTSCVLDPGTAAPSDRGAPLAGDGPGSGALGYVACRGLRRVTQLLDRTKHGDSTRTARTLDGGIAYVVLTLSDKVEQTTSVDERTLSYIRFGHYLATPWYRYP